MAKKKGKINEDLFGSTEAPKEITKQNDPINRQGVGLKQSDVDRLDTIANDTHFSRHSLMVYAVRYFLRDYEDGKIELKEGQVKPQHKPLEMP